jgi:hypothetical protein
MGTNFYWNIGRDRCITVKLPTGAEFELSSGDMDPRIHIGKRSGAGAYCWDCNCTLCPEGEARIHYSRHPWPSTCPSCGKEQIKEGLTAGPAAVELGFADAATERPTGVRGACSFSWAQDPEIVRRICTERPDEELVVDEYDRKLTGKEFLGMLRACCPIESLEHLGVCFS